MRLSSKGLGKITLPFRFTEARITEAHDYVVFEGMIKEKKVNWTYRAEVEDADLLNFVMLARDPAVVDYIADRVGLGLFGNAARAAMKLILHPLRRAVPAPPDSRAAVPAPAAASAQDARTGTEAL